jgi:hypothetical protein
MSQVGLLTVEEAAAFIHETASPSMIRAAINHGQLQAVRLGRRFYVHEAEIRRFIGCPANESPPASTGAKTMGPGSSSTADGKSGLALVTDFVTRQKQFAEPIHSARRPSQDRGTMSTSDEISVGEVLVRYAEHKRQAVKDPERLLYTVKALAPYWANMTAAEVYGYDACRDLRAGSAEYPPGPFAAK